MWILFILCRGRQQILHRHPLKICLGKIYFHDFDEKTMSKRRLNHQVYNGKVIENRE